MEYRSIEKVIPYYCSYGGNCVECEYFEGIEEGFEEILVKCTRDGEEQ